MQASESLSPVVQRRRLRTELRRARLDAELTQEQVATAMDWSLSKLIRIENGTVGISTNDLKAILAHYKITDDGRAAEMLALARGSRERSWWSAYRDASPRLIQLIEYESASYIIRNFQPMLIPGLLQTEEYAATMIRNLIPQAPTQDVNTTVEIRMRRQQLLRQPETPLMFFIMDEAAVRRLVGGPEAMRRQLQRLLDESDKPTVTIEVVPFSAGAHPGMQGPFMLFEFPDAADDDALYLEAPNDARLNRDDAEEISLFRERFEVLRELSLGPQGSRDLLGRLLGEL
ncbi:MAG TPA: helix-turn-helix transcriptional regulator [Trebonia sp.]|jgi:transcriptional regulator with XRE-family HTH domain|nr:helix-turn-helix transcriptional regulator [Trebonia sp.]